MAATVLMAIARRTAGTAVDAAEGLAVVAEIEDAVVVADVRVVAADGIVADGIAGGGIVVGAGVSLVAKLVASKVAGIRGWIRCGSGLRRVVLGRVRRTMSLWI